MKGLTKFLITAVVASAVVIISSCAVSLVHPVEGYGPPQHAPAHGYRYRHQGHDVVYDSNLGVYIVVGFQDYYFYDNYYYRYDHDHWYYSRELDRDWRDYKESKLPPGLAKKYGYGKKDKRNRDNRNR